MKTKKAALVCSGGGALGMAHLGAVEVLKNAGYDFDFFAGVSAGSIAVAGMACEKSVGDIKKLLSTKSVVSLLFEFSWNRFGILRGEKIHKILQKTFQNQRIEDLPFPLYVGATDFSNGERVFVSKGTVADAVRASMSVPVLFEPFYHKELKKWLVDGGLSQNLPLDIATEKYKGNTIFCIDVASCVAPRDDFSDTKKVFGNTKVLACMLQRTFNILFKNQQTSFKDDARVVRIQPDLDGFLSYDVFGLSNIFERGILAARKALHDNGRRKEG
jgi:NTE family protein